MRRPSLSTVTLLFFILCLLGGAVIAPAPSFAQPGACVTKRPKACDGDVNADGRTDIVDLGIIIANWGATPGDPRADINNDGNAGVLDYVIWLACRLSNPGSGSLLPLCACSDTLDNDNDGAIDYPADPGCANSSDGDENNCGNGQLNAGEQCDPSTSPPIPAGTTCINIGQGYTGGTLSCKPSGSTGQCNFNTSLCTSGPNCGNGLIDAGEICDPTANPAVPAGTTCTTLGQGFIGGNLTCNPVGSANQCTFNTGQCTSLPDLTVQPTGSWPTTGAPGQSISFIFNTSNAGGAPAGTFTDSLMIDGVVASSRVVTQLNQGGNNTYGFSWTATCGVHTITVITDSFDGIQESNEGNNLTSVHTINVTGIACNPDTTPPIVTAFDVQPRSTQGSVVISWTAQDNIGLARVEIYRAAYSILQCDETNQSGCQWTLEQPSIPSLNQNPWSGTSSYMPPPGTWMIGIHSVDTSGNWGREPSPPGSIKLTKLAAAPDLTVLQTGAWTATASPGQSLNFVFTTSNSGTASAANFTDALLVDGNSVASRIVPLADPNQNNTSGLAWTAACGTHTIAVRTDFFSTVPESNEGNNQTNPHTISVTGGACSPDIIAPIITAFDVQPRSTTGVVTATCTATDNTALQSMHVMRTPDLNGLPNQNAWFQIFMQPSSGTLGQMQYVDTPPQGTFWYGCQAFDTQGNKGIEPNPPGPIRITTQSLSPDLIVLPVGAWPTTASPGQSISFTFTTNNSGTGSAANFTDALLVDGTSAASRIVTQLTSGQNNTIGLSWTAACGTHTIVVRTDTNNTVAESNEGNNQTNVHTINVTGPGCSIILPPPPPPAF